MQSTGKLIHSGNKYIIYRRNRIAAAAPLRNEQKGPWQLHRSSGQLSWLLLLSLHQFADHLAHLRRVRFSFHLLHNLAHQKAENFCFSTLVLLHGFRV